MQSDRTPSTDRTYPISDIRQGDSLADFTLRATVHENIVELRRALGSVTRPLSRADLAKVLNDQDPARQRNYSTIERWENAGIEPDYRSTKLMADLAGVSFEDFALGVPEVRQSEGGDRVDVGAVPGRRRKPA